MGAGQASALGAWWRDNLEDPMRFLAPVALVIPFFAGSALAQTQADPEAATGLAAKAEFVASKEMVVAANPLATKAGADILARGGSAVDAAIATLLVLNVVEPQSSGIGGGAFALIHGPSGLVAWDGREMAPAGASPDMFMEDGDTLPFRTAVASGRSTGVPSLIRLIGDLHDRHGRLPLADLFAPAISLARDGFEVSPRLAGLLAASGSRLQGAARDVFVPGEVALTEGTLLRQPALAETFQMLASGGPEVFYAGAIAEAIVGSVKAEPRPGSLSLADLKRYRVLERTPVCHPYRGYRVCGMGPPSSGATTVGQILMLMEEALPTVPDVGDPVLWHAFAEASKLAYADRAAYLGDSDFVKVPVKGLLDPGYMAARAKLIDLAATSSDRATAGDPPWREGRYAPDLGDTRPGTTHLVVVDKDGLAVSITATIESAFGSGRMAAGFLLNNELTDFSFRPVDGSGKAVANAVSPGKRPRSSMAPTMVYQGDRLVALVGSPGGSRIPEYVAQAVVLLLDYGMSPAAAAAWPHISQRNRDALAVEPAFDSAVANALQEKGHVIDRRAMVSGLHIITVGKDGVLTGGADPRREGMAIGR